MEEMMETVVAQEDFDRNEQRYLRELELDGRASIEAKFGYAFCLVRCAHKQDIAKGIELLEELMEQHHDGRRDYLYYLALGEARMKNYSLALNYCKVFLEIEDNPQVRSLEEYIQTRYDKDLKKGLAVAGGAVLVLGGILGLGMALAKNKNRRDK
ncbi:PREDICTED: mitochondrial fission 1 protein-like [Rhagoletis zephyria]|uniref:mitochondrial fission 1 protein-like n=1 Tax=Rhagoletis zephyria TaxID=28612 RepID=UPI00081179F0|nr:PREDICTED: mitochondrial fission 1 protein-like [Rhagoletis zephyria]